MKKTLFVMFMLFASVLLFGAIAFAADPVTAAVPPDVGSLAWFIANINPLAAIATTILLAVSELLSLTGATKANGVIQLIINLLKALTGQKSDNSQSGFVGIRLLASMLIISFAFALLSGCATTGTATPAANDSPVILAGKSLLTVKATITTAAKATDALCQAGKISTDKCVMAKDAYVQAKTAYDSAVDAYLLLTQGGDPAKFADSLQRCQNIAGVFLKLAESK